ncbi:hypothetical protein Y032_0031g2276 [Ancylostoma ceylanicum]|uniref:PDZ domain-containing protein n=2 Tax=Ancylostoma ceylanicum TaxID=53326 RepID=A0A016URJ0_9BILA|nr:hypothetical protein Y032_0031g2276 [Ancylostoma ceylanicum]
MSTIVMNPENQKHCDTHGALVTGEKETALDAATADAHPHAGPQRERNFIVRPGFAYYLVTITFSEGLKFGLCVKHYRNQVIVSKVEEGSLAAESLRVMDRIVDVNSMPVTDKDVCKTLIVNSLTQAGVVTMIVERPVDAAAIEAMENALSASLQQPPSVALASDVKSIVRRYTEKLKSGHGEKKPVKILLEPGSTGKAHGHVKIPENDRREMLIGMDNEDRAQRLQSYEYLESAFEEQSTNATT